MAIEFEICEAGHVTVYRIRGSFSLKELTDYYPRDLAHRDSVPYIVHGLTIISELTELPSHILSVRRNAPGFAHPRSGYVTIAGANNMIRVFADTVSRLVRFEKTRFFSSEAEAWTFLRAAIAQETGNDMSLKR